MDFCLLRPFEAKVNLFDQDLRSTVQEPVGTDLWTRFWFERGQILKTTEHLVIRHGRFPIYIFRHLTPEGEAERIEVTASSTSISDDPVPSLARGDLLIFPAQTLFVPLAAPFGALQIIIDGVRYEPWRVPTEKITLVRVMASDGRRDSG